MQYTLWEYKYRKGIISVKRLCYNTVFTLEHHPFYNPYDDVHLFYGKHGKLPHMHQGSIWYFVTFRLADSLPQDKVEQLHRERNEWLARHDSNNLTKEEKHDYYKLFSKRVEQWLANGYGSCLLKEERIARIVAEAILHFNHKRYDVDEWVIMPNHVHLLIKPREGYSLSDILHSIKSYSAHKINEVLGRSGDVWLHESYDHMVRNERALEALRNYIRQNPLKAGLTLPAVCCSWLYGSEDTTTAQLRGSEEASALQFNRSEDASATLMLWRLFDYSDEGNPFHDRPDITEKLIDAIENIKILDPACGSGAFPMGVLHKLVLALHKLDPENTLWKQRLLKRVPPEIRSETEKSLENKPIDYIRKLGLIENCIYGVDIQEIAIQISKLRFFISLLVEQDVDDTKPNRDIRALPNLETKFVAANTLIALEKPIQFGMIEPHVTELEEQLFKVREELFYTNSRAEKLRLQNKEKKLREELRNALKNSGFSAQTAKQIASWDPFDQNTHAN